MSDEILIRYCAPTLAGIKTGNLFGFTFSSWSEMAGEVRRLNRILVPKGLCMLPLRYRNSRALLYVYRPGRLARDLEEESCRTILEWAGYEKGTAGQQLRRLIQKLGREDDFPHEIGLFLGYPPEDVRGFLEHGNETCTGFWKVYGDKKKAERVFRKYRCCYTVYRRQFQAGTTLGRLAVRERPGSRL